MPNNQNIDNRREIEEIKARLDIVDLISQYIKVRKSGRNYSAVCPFHQEKTPSFMISPDLQMYKCFGCGKSGDVFEFIMEYEHLDFPEALEKLAKRAGVKLPKKGFSKENKHLAILEMINHLANKFYKKELQNNKKAMKYLKNRGFNDESIQKFELGYAPSGNKLQNHIKKKASFTPEQLAKSGLFKNKNGKPSDKFRDRLMFPIKNTRGKIIGFTGRVLPGNDWGPKYLNSPDTPIFHKSNTAFGIYESKNHIRGDDLCILCEGSTDVIAAHQHGVKNIVAPLGTSLTDGQIEIISKYTKNVLLLLDNDEAGQRALERAFLLFSKHEFNTYATNTGKFKDLGELIENKPKSLKKVIENRLDAFTYLLSRKLENLDTANYEDHQKLLDYIGVLLQNTKDKAILDFYFDKIEKLTGIRHDVIQERITDIRKKGSLGRGKRNSNQNQGKTNQNNYNGQDMREVPGDTVSVPKTNFRKKSNLSERLIGLILQSERFKLIDELEIKGIFFDQKWIIKFIDAVKSSSDKEEINELINDLKKNQPKLENLLLDAEIARTINDPEMDLKSELRDTYERVKKGFYQKKLRKLRSDLVLEEEKADSDSEVIKDLLNRIQEISKKING